MPKIRKKSRRPIIYRLYDQNHISRSTNRLIVYMKNPDLDCQRAYKQAP